MSGSKLKEEGLDLKSEVTNNTQDLPINQASSLKTNMLLSVQYEKVHIPRTINYPEMDKLLKDKHVKCSISGQMSDKPLLGKSENVQGCAIGNGILAMQDGIKSSIDEGCDQNSRTMYSGLEISTHGFDNRGLWSIESSSCLDDVPNSVGKMTSVTSPTHGRRQKRKMEMVAMSDPSEDLYTIASLDSQLSDEMFKGEQTNGSSQLKIPNVRLLDTFGCVSRPETKQVKRSSAISQNAVDEWEQKNKDMVLRPETSDQSNENKKMHDFDSEHSSSSLDNYDDANDFNWDPQKEFIKFLWDNLDDQDQKNAEVSAHIVRKQRASIDTGTDYTNDLCMNFIQKTGQHDHRDPSIYIMPQEKDLGTTQVVRCRKYYKEHVKCVNTCINGKREGTEHTSTGCELSVLKEELLESGSNVKPLFSPCTNCDITCKDRTLLHRHIRQHGEPVNQAQTLSLICRECGWSCHRSASLLQHRSIHKEKQHILIEELKEIVSPKVLNAENNTTTLTDPRNPGNVSKYWSFGNSEIIESNNQLPSPGQHCLSTSSSLFQELENSPSKGKGSSSNLERMPDLIGTEKALQNHNKGLKPRLHTSVNMLVSQNTNEQASHDYRSDAQERRTDSSAFFFDCNDHCNKIINSNECENYEQQNEDGSCHTSDEAFLPQLMGIMDSTSQWQADIKDDPNISGKLLNIKKPETNSSLSKNITTQLHDMEVHDGSLHLPVCQNSLQKEELNNLSVKDSQNPVAENLKINGDVGQVRRKEVSSMSEPQSDSDFRKKPCPAMFETGVRFSDHTRGHLQRIGMTTHEQHVIPSQEITFLDMQNTRGMITSVPAGSKKTSEQMDEVHTESPAEVTCPLCGVRFDTKKGLSNHVRGHLKRLGKAYSTATFRSPLDILKQLMSNRKEFQKTLQAFHKRQITSKTYSRKDPFFLSIESFTENDQNCCEVLAEGAKNKQFEVTDSEKSPPSSDLIGMLKKRKAHQVKNLNHTTRKALSLPLQQTDSLSEKSHLNGKVCEHCNAAFHSGISLSNHLRAYEKRKRAALRYGTTYDCKQRKQRSGSKKKIFPLPYTTEKIYRLTCRFCDLVFQGPLSVQEDWIKHLQRHIINTSVPHTGVCMVEVTSLPMGPVSERRTEASLFLTEVLT
ncbi:hypothetical protein AALO_G00020060 [Alosa alosa]|uniref:C2H2-type domain-containing protein n=1 Tax=Alosa alosa TaxID=278164 RepID=A0AAV6HL94_9TELE|nr:zinc finger protein 644a [Alosa alosa]KAG5286895.1 hypothetical protein AALO_G00020060 [Alosa alosa]